VICGVVSCQDAYDDEVEDDGKQKIIALLGAEHADRVLPVLTKLVMAFSKPDSV